MDGQRVGYVRVSSFDQNPDRQLEAASVARTFIDKASGKDTQRPELDRLLAFVRDTSSHLPARLPPAALLPTRSDQSAARLFGEYPSAHPARSTSTTPPRAALLQCL
jgi:hypothetical protein